MYAGLDIHKRFTQFAVADDKGQIVNEGRFVNEDKNFDEFLKILDEGAKIIMEACYRSKPPRYIMERNVQYICGRKERII